MTMYTIEAFIPVGETKAGFSRRVEYGRTSDIDQAFDAAEEVFLTGKYARVVVMLGEEKVWDSATLSFPRAVVRS